MGAETGVIPKLSETQNCLALVVAFPPWIGSRFYHGRFFFQEVAINLLDAALHYHSQGYYNSGVLRGFLLGRGGSA